MPGSSSSKRFIASALRARVTAFPLLVAGLAFLVVLSVTLYAQFAIQARDDQERQAHHEFARAHVGQNLQNYLKLRFLTVGGIVSTLAMADGGVDERDFRRLAERFHEDFSGVQAFNWIDASGVARWIVPLEGNEAVKDKDLSALEVPGRAIAAAIGDGRPHATPPIDLLQSGRGFASYFPVFRDGKLLGLVNVVFRFNDLLDSIAGLDPRGRISVALYYEDQFVLEQSGAPETVIYSSLFHELEVLDQRFQIDVRAHSATARWVNPVLPVLLVNLLFAAALYLLVKQLGLLARGEERLRDYTDIAFDYLWETDEEQRLTYLSETFEEIVGRPAHEFIGRRLVECGVKAASDSALGEHAANMGHRRSFVNFVFCIERPDGTKNWISSSGKPRFGPNGRFLGYRGADRSINEQMTTERRLRRAWEHAEAANRAKSNFLAGMSHELRTPLNSIIGFSEIIRDEMLGPVGKPQYVEYANDVVTSGRHLLSLVDDVLDLSKIESSTFELSEDNVELADAFEFVWRGFRRLAESRGIGLDIDVAENARAVKADTRLVRQMVMNLVSNAIKFTDHRGRVTIRSLRDGDGCVHIQIEDTGIGIPDEHVERVTEPFVQVRETALLSHEGSGLGLSLVKRFVELHGGTIELKSEVGTGTLVDLTFPRNRS